MSFYIVIEIEVTDADAYAEYVARVPETVEKYGGKYLVRGGAVVTLQGDWKPERVIVLEFPSAEQASTWAFSPEYSAVSPIREKAAKTRAIGVQGVDSPA